MDKTKIFYSSEIDYSKKTDEELVEIIKTGDKLAANYIIDRYKNLVNIKVSKYYIAGAEKDDIMQEGLIGLFKAIKCYSPEQNSSFKSFANFLPINFVSSSEFDIIFFIKIPQFIFH